MSRSNTFAGALSGDSLTKGANYYNQDAVRVTAANNTFASSYSLADSLNNKI